MQNDNVLNIKDITKCKKQKKDAKICYKILKITASFQKIPHFGMQK